MAQHRHKRETNAPRTPRAFQVAAPLAVVATLSAVTLGVLSASPAPADRDLLASSTTGDIGAPVITRVRSATVSRSQSRRDRQREDAAADHTSPDALARAQARQQARKQARRQARKQAALELQREREASRRAVRQADTRLWTTAELNVWSSPSPDAELLGTLDALKKVLATGRRDNGRAEIVLDGSSRWVTADYLTADKPDRGPSLGGSCANGSSIDAGRQSLYAIHEAVCANWPQVTSYGTWRGDGDHGQGRAIDIMVSGDLGWEIAEFLRDNYASLDIEYLIYSQKIWSVDRAGEGWRGMSNRGSATANHYDHVHVTVY